MTINLENPDISKIAELSIPLAEVISPLMDDGMSIDEVAGYLTLVLLAKNMEEVKKGNISINQARANLGLPPM